MTLPGWFPFRALLLSALCLGVLGAQDYSRHCKGPGEAKPGIADGTYKGTWEMKVTFSHDLGGTPLTQTITGQGSFTLKASRNSGEPAASSIEGLLKTTTQMRWSGPGGGQAKQDLNGQAPLTLDGEVEPTEFRVKADHHTSGSLQVSAMIASSSVSQSFADTVTLAFQVEQGDCDGAEGTVRSDSVEEMINSMKDAGYNVERADWRWRMTRVPEDGDPIQKFKAELEKQAPAGIHRTREAEAQRLAELADRIKNDEEPSIRECLWQLWQAYANRQCQAWAQEDIRNLAVTGYQGDWPALRERINRAIATDRSLSLMGADTCNEALHNELWKAMTAALRAYLKKMADGHAAKEHILDVLRASELLGAVAPALEEQATLAIQADAKEWAGVTLGQLKAAVQVARAAGREPGKDPAVREALTRAIGAEKTAELVGLEINQARDYAASAGLI